MRDVIIIGSNYSSTLGLARSLGEAGFGVRLLALTDLAAAVVGASKYVKKMAFVHVDFFEETSADDEIRALEELRGGDEKILVFPSRDITCKMLEKHWAQLSEHYYFPNIHGIQGELFHFSDKAVQKKLAERCGLRTAGGKAYSTDEHGIKQAISEVRFPCFMKPLQSSETKKRKCS